MNKRIRELAEQARKYASEYVEDEVEMQFHKKFAELIVRECLEIIEEMDPHSVMRDIDDIYVVVEKHFGVEE